MAQKGTVSQALYEIFVASKETQLFNAIRRGDANRVSELIEAGVRSDTLRNYMTPLVYAVSKTPRARLTSVLNALFAHRDSFDVLLNQGNKHYHKGQNPLITASRKGNIEAVKLLLQQTDIDVNATSAAGSTALMFAAQNGHSNVVERLLQQPDIDVTAKNIFGKTVLMYAAEHGYSNVVGSLLKQPGIDVNEKSHDGFTALMYAANYGHSNVVELLLQQPDIDVNAKDIYGFTALMYAAYNGHSSVIKLLLQQSDIDVNAKNIYGKTVLMYAAARGASNVVEQLLQQPNINVNAKSDTGFTALMHAAYFEYSNVVELLLQQPGIDVNAKDKRGRTALNLTWGSRITRLIKTAQENQLAQMVIRTQEARKKITASFQDKEANLIKQLGAEKVALAIPKACYCPLTSQLVIDPVLMGDGRFYEKEAIITYFNGDKTKVSPVTQDKNNPLHFDDINKTSALERQFIHRLIDSSLCKLEAEAVRLKNASGASTEPGESLEETNKIEKSALDKSDNNLRPSPPLKLTFDEREEALKTQLSPEEIEFVIPKECYCPMGLALIEDPVLMSDGYVYERSAMAVHFAGKSQQNSPVNPDKVLYADEIKKPFERMKAFIRQMIEDAFAKLEALQPKTATKTSVVNHSVFSKHTTEIPSSVEPSNSDTLDVKKSQ